MCKVCDGTVGNRGHVWQLDEDGEPDIFAFEEGFHNGLRCTRCSYSFCHHCSEGPEEDCVYIDQLEIPL